MPTYVQPPRMAVKHMDTAEGSLQNKVMNGLKARNIIAEHADMTTEDKTNIAAYVSSESPAVDFG